MVIATGYFARLGSQYRREGIQIYEDFNWKTIDYQNQALLSSTNTWENGHVGINPKDDKNMVVTTYSPDGMIWIENDQVTNLYNTSNSNLQVSTNGSGDVITSDPIFDEKGNLFVLNPFSNNPLKVRSAGGQWYEYPTGSFANSVWVNHMTMDYDGNKFFGVFNKGLVAYQDNGTIENTADDKYVYLKEGKGLGNLPSNNISALAVDFDNELWIGTPEGLVVLYNANKVFNDGANIDATEVLINFNGSTEVLLDGLGVTDIEIDGGNRKWIATSNNGIYCVSADGQEIVYNFTKDNSPLIDNSIIDMKFDQKTGELFIVSERGLVSYRVDASYEDEEYASTIVFPNPVKPNFFGPITIQGIRYNSDVKVTDIAGNLVFKTTSNGGTATWNGKNINGEDVAAGVYIFWTATNDEKFKKAGKVVVIR